MASAVSSLLGSSGASSGAAGATAAGKPPSEQMFLQLLVAQIQNQDPLNPADSTQFVAQLAQFSELEQVIGIRSDIEKAQSANSSPGSAAAGGSTKGTSGGTDPAAANQSLSGQTNPTNGSGASTPAPGSGSNSNSSPFQG